MRNPFRNIVFGPLSEAEKFLKEWKIEYGRQPDGKIVVEGNIDLSFKNLARLPNLAPVVVQGTFSCYNNGLFSLEGVPAYVGGDFSCAHNQLVSLEGAPAYVGGAFNCYHNQLTSLKGAPQAIGGDFFCHNNQLSSLEHMPQKFQELHSDFGEFPNWIAVPPSLRSPT